jgi:hypothetical protein
LTSAFQPGHFDRQLAAEEPTTAAPQGAKVVKATAAGPEENKCCTTIARENGLPVNCR